MCLAVPFKILEIEGDHALLEMNGVKRTANMVMISEPRIGDYVLVHAGFAIQKWSPKDYEEYREIIEEMARLE